jgi:ubiquinone/menaquinone biosynthesis C-methylase UbiE
MTYQIDRERDFHNMLYSENLGERKKLLPFYEASRLARKRFYDLVSQSIYRGGKVLDYGCGLGDLALFIANIGAKTIGIDISDQAINKAQKRAYEYTNDVSFIKMDAQELKFDDSYFDLVCGIAIIHHLNPGRAYYEVSRVLKPTGRAIFLEPLGHNFFINLFRRCTPNLRSFDEKPLRYPDIREANKYFEKVDCEWYALTTLAVIPFIKTALKNPLLVFFEKLDNILIKNHRYLGKYGWQVIIQLERPCK